MSFDGNRFTHDQEKYSYTLVPVLAETSVTEYTYIVNFSGEGASSTPYTVQSTNSSITIDLSQFAPTAPRGSMVFRGWATSSGSTATVNSITITHADNDGVVTIYAVWTYILTVVLTEGSQSQSVSDLTWSTDAQSAPTHAFTLPTPTPKNAAQWAFVGWAETENGTTYVSTVTLNHANAQSKTMYARWQVQTYTITWKNGDTTLDTDTLAYGATPAYSGATPTKDQDAQYTYSFSGWSPAIVTVTGPATYSAQFTPTIRSYEITFVNHDGTPLQSSGWNYGTTPEYSGETPTKAPNAQYSYVFSGWSPQVVEVVGGATYTAQFDSTVNEYDITWIDGDGNTLAEDQIAYGTVPTYTGSVPTKAPNAQYTYSFSEWSPQVVAVTGDATYTAQFTSTVNKYLVRFIIDGTIRQETLVEYGVTPEYVGSEEYLNKEGNTFQRWYPDISPVTGVQEYIALWTTNSYTVTLNPAGGSFTTAPAGWAYSNGRYTKDFDFGSQLDLPESITKTYYKFSGWGNLPADGKMPAHALELTATWALKSIVLTVTDGAVPTITIQPSAEIGNVSYTATDSVATITRSANEFTLTPTQNGACAVRIWKGSVEATVTVNFSEVRFSVRTGETGSNLTSLFWGQTGNSSHTFDLSAVSPVPSATKPDNIFLNWTTVAQSETVYATGDTDLAVGTYPPVTMSTSEATARKTVYPQWGQYRHTVTFVYPFGTPSKSVAQKVIDNATKMAFTYTLAAADNPNNDAAWDFTHNSVKYTVTGWTTAVTSSAYGRTATPPTLLATGSIEETVNARTLYAVVRPVYILAVKARANLSGPSATYSKVGNTEEITEAYTLSDWSDVTSAIEMSARNDWTVVTTSIPAPRYTGDAQGTVSNTGGYMSYRVSVSMGTIKVGGTYATSIPADLTITIDADSTVWYETVVTFEYQKRCRVTFNTNYSSLQYDDEEEVVTGSSASWRTKAQILEDTIEVNPAGFEKNGLTQTGWTTSSSVPYDMDGSHPVGWVAIASPVSVDFGEHTYYAVWQATATLRYIITTQDGQGNAKESIVDPGELPGDEPEEVTWVNDGIYRVYTCTETLLLGETKVWKIITTLVACAAGAGVVGWEFGGWTKGSSKTPVYASQKVTGTDSPSTSITVSAAELVELTPKWVQQFTKTVTFYVTTDLKIVCTYTDAEAHTHTINGFVPTVIGADDQVYQLSNGNWVGATVDEINAVRDSSNFVGWSTSGTDEAGAQIITLDLPNEAGQTYEYYAIYRPKYTLNVQYRQAADNSSSVADTTSNTVIPVGVTYLPAQVNDTASVSTQVSADITSTIPTSQAGVFRNWAKVEQGAVLTDLQPNISTISATFGHKGDQEITLVLVPRWTETCAIYIKMGRYDNDGNLVGEIVDFPERGAIYASKEFQTALSISRISYLVIPGVAGTDSDHQNMWTFDSAYLGVNPTGRALSGYTASTDTFVYTPSSNDGASQTLFLKYVYATYRLKVDQGSNLTSVDEFADSPNDEEYFAHTGTVWEKSIRYTGERVTTALAQFAGDQADALISDGQNAFSGYAYNQNDRLEYRAGEQVYGYKLRNGTYPAHGDVVELVAVWGSFATSLEWGNVLYTKDGVIATLVAQPSATADGSVQLSDESRKYPSNSGNGAELSGSDLSWECTTEGISNAITIHFNTPGRYHLVFTTVAQNPNAVAPTATLDVIYTELAFSAYSSTTGLPEVIAENMPIVRVPDTIKWVARYDAETPSSLTVNDLSPYTASVGTIPTGGNGIFGGWAVREDLTENYTVFTPLTSVTVPIGTRATVYALWEMNVIYALNGGNWLMSQDITKYMTLREGLLAVSQGETVELTSVRPIHPTKRFSVWEVRDNFNQTPIDIIRENEILFRFGTVLARAIWVVENLQWMWGHYAIEYVPRERVIDEGDTEADRGMVRPIMAWHPQSNAWGIEFNNEYNIPSHITNIPIPTDSNHILELYALGEALGGEVLVWTGCYQGSFNEDSTVTVMAIDLPRLVVLGGNDENRAVGRIWTKGEDGAFEECVPESGRYVITVGTSVITKLYLRTDDGAEILYNATADSPAFITIDSELSSGVSSTIPYTYANTYTTGSWTTLSNKVDHQLRLNIPDKPFVSGVYRLQADSYGTWYFREIHENWISISPNEYPVLEYDSGARSYYVGRRFGSLRTSIRADGGYYAVSFSTHPTLVSGDPSSRIERMYVALIHIVDEVPDAPFCKITKYVSARSGDPEILFLSTSTQPNLSITSVTRGFRAQLNQSPMLTKSSQFNYIIDLGNTETLGVTLTRTQPEKVNDDDPTNSHPETWSNGKWIWTVKQFFDQWQNANYNAKQERSGGYNLIFDPVVDYNGYPKLDKNVFLSAPLTYKFDRALVNLSLQFTVASMLGRHATQPRYIYFHYKTSATTEAVIQSKTYTEEYVVPAIPYDAYEDRENNRVQVGWRYWINNNGQQGIVTYPGEHLTSALTLISPTGSITSAFSNEAQDASDNSVLHMYAFYATRKLAMVFDDTTESVVNLEDYSSKLSTSEQQTTTTTVWMKITAVGGGGGGGSSYLRNYKVAGGRMPARYTDFKLGGGGGSGYVRYRTARLTTLNHSLRVHVGSGGGSETPGGDTFVIVGGAVFIMAPGGGNGSRDKSGIGGHNGGEHATENGMSSSRMSNIKGNNGAPLEDTESLDVLGGPGTSMVIDGTDVVMHPGSGGGAAGINTALIGSSQSPVLIFREGSVDDSEDNSIRVKSIGGSLMSQTIPAATGSGKTDVPSGHAMFGGGGCSEISKANVNSSGWSTEYVTEGHSGANGVVIIEFYS